MLRSAAISVIEFLSPHRGRCALLWCVLCLAFLVRAYLFPGTRTVYPHYTHAGRAWVAGEDAYELQWSGGDVVARQANYRYAPPATVFFVPFTLFPDNVGAVLWRLLNYVCFFGGIAWFLREAFGERGSFLHAQTAFCWFAMIPLSVISMNNGQANVLMVGLLAASAAALLSERWNVAALLLAAACILKALPIAVALLFLLIYPRKLTGRFVLAMLVGLAAPFAFQSTSYVVEQYRNWLLLMGADDRREFPMQLALCDFHLLTRFVGLPLSSVSYLALQLVTAAAVAGVCLFGRYKGWPLPRLVLAAWTLGCAWLAIFGPSVETATYILIAPPLAIALSEALRTPAPLWSRILLGAVLFTFTLVGIASWSRWGGTMVYGLQPLAALVFFVERMTAALLPLPASAQCALLRIT